jgi:hypothetical protein
LLNSKKNLNRVGKLCCSTNFQIGKTIFNKTCVPDRRFLESSRLNAREPLQALGAGFVHSSCLDCASAGPTCSRCRSFLFSSALHHQTSTKRKQTSMSGRQPPPFEYTVVEDSWHLGRPLPGPALWRPLPAGQVQRVRAGDAIMWLPSDGGGSAKMRLRMMDHASGVSLWNHHASDTRVVVRPTVVSHLVLSIHMSFNYGNRLIHMQAYFPSGRLALEMHLDAGVTITYRDFEKLIKREAKCEELAAPHTDIHLLASRAGTRLSPLTALIWRPKLAYGTHGILRRKIKNKTPYAVKLLEKYFLPTE